VIDQAILFFHTLAPLVQIYLRLFYEEEEGSADVE